VAIVNQSFARKYWGNQSPLGHQVRPFNPAQAQPWRTIVGVVPDTLMQGPFNREADSTGFYVPLLGASPAPQFCTIVVRPHPGQAAETLGPALSKAVAQIDSDLPTYFPGTPARSHSEFLSGPRLVAQLFSIFGALAMSAGAGDLRMIRAGGLQGTARVKRHLWRMSVALFIASASFFLGPVRRIPEPLRLPALRLIPFLVLATMAYWLWRYRRSRRSMTARDGINLTAPEAV